MGLFLLFSWILPMPGHMGQRSWPLFIRTIHWTITYHQGKSVSMFCKYPLHHTHKYIIFVSIHFITHKYIIAQIHLYIFSAEYLFRKIRFFFFLMEQAYSENIRTVKIQIHFIFNVLSSFFLSMFDLLNIYYSYTTLISVLTNICSSKNDVWNKKIMLI